MDLAAVVLQLLSLQRWFRLEQLACRSDPSRLEHGLAVQIHARGLHRSARLLVQRWPGRRAVTARLARFHTELDRLSTQLDAVAHSAQSGLRRRDKRRPLVLLAVQQVALRLQRVSCERTQRADRRASRRHLSVRASGRCQLHVHAHHVHLLLRSGAHHRVVRLQQLRPGDACARLRLVRLSQSVRLCEQLLLLDVQGRRLHTRQLLAKVSARVPPEHTLRFL